MTTGEHDERLEELKLAAAADCARATGGLVDLEWQAQHDIERGTVPETPRRLNSEPGNALSVIRRFL